MRTPCKYLLQLTTLLISACGAPPATNQEVGVTVPAPQFIINGQLDEGQYPQVGTLVRPNPLVTGGPLLSRCTGTLIAKDVFLTAGHCLKVVFDAGLQYGDYGVSFDPVYVPGVSKVILGHGYVHPEFNFDDYHSDVSIVILDEPVTGVRPMKLVRPRLLEKMSAEELAEETIVTVGYGFSTFPPPGTGRGTRRVAVQQFLGLCTIVDSSGECVPGAGHPDDNSALVGGLYADGYGNTCTGDSGGPHFLDGRIMSVTSVGRLNCGDGIMAVAPSQRVDIKPVRQFIMSFLDDDEDDDARPSEGCDRRGQGNPREPERHP